jgi:hypothetical protein
MLRCVDSSAPNLQSAKLVHGMGGEIRHPNAQKAWDGARLSNVAATLRLTAKRLGWLHTLLWSCASLGRRFSTHIFMVTTHPIAEDEADLPVSMEGFECRLLSNDDVVRFFNRLDGESYSRAFAMEALSRSDRCFGVFEGGHLVWYCWYARQSAPIFDDVDAAADFPCVYAYNAHTDAAHRGRGLHRIGVESSARFFAREGYRAFTAYIEVLNLAPLIAARKMGERVDGFVMLYRSPRGVRWIASPGCRKAAFRVRRRRTDTAYDGPPTKTGGRPLEPEPPHRVGALTPIPIPDPLLQLSEAAAVTSTSAKRRVREIKTDTSAAPAVHRRDRQ